MYKILVKVIIASAVITFLPVAVAYSAELVTTPAEAVARVEEEDYVTARATAVKTAFSNAVRMTVAGLVDEKNLRSKQAIELVETVIVSHSVDFVKSYKFLEEKIDNIKGRLEVRLQVTLYLNDVRNAIRNAGLTPKKRELPKLLILVEEKTTGLFTENNFLLLKSMSEEKLSKGFRDKGYQVADRRTIQKAGMGKMAISAVKRNKEAIRSLGRSLDADIILFGKTEVLANTTEKGEHIMAIIKLSMLLSADGRTIASFREEADGVYPNVLEGTQNSINNATKKIDRELSRVIPKKWKELQEQSGG